MTEVAVALISTVGIITVAMIQQLRAQNSREHGETGRRLDRVISAIGRVEHKIEQHLDDHKETQ